MGVSGILPEVQRRLRPCGQDARSPTAETDCATSRSGHTHANNLTRGSTCALAGCDPGALAGAVGRGGPCQFRRTETCARLCLAVFRRGRRNQAAGAQVLPRGSLFGYQRFGLIRPVPPKWDGRRAKWYRWRAKWYPYHLIGDAPLFIGYRRWMKRGRPPAKRERHRAIWERPRMKWGPSQMKRERPHLAEGRTLLAEGPYHFAHHPSHFCAFLSFLRAIER